MRDIELLLEAIQAALPEDAVLYLENSRRYMPSELLEFLDGNPAPHPRQVARGTLWPKPATFHVVALPSTLERLRDVASRHAAPEVCDHLVVYRDDDVLLTAYDAGGGSVFVAKSLGQATIARMRLVLEGTG